MKNFGIWVVVLSIVFAVLPFLLSYPAVWVGYQANCYGLLENITCEIWGMNVASYVSFFSSLGLLVFLTAPISLVGIVIGLVILAAAMIDRSA